MKSNIKARTIVIVVLLLIAIAPLTQILFKTFAANTPSHNTNPCQAASPSATADFTATATVSFSPTATTIARVRLNPITCIPASSTTTMATESTTAKLEEI